MSPDRWRQIEDIFQAAMEVDAGARSAFLSGACAGDAELLEQVGRLLRHAEPADDFLETSAVECFGGEPPPGREPQRIGPYRVVRRIGDGGMGTVYLAHRADEEYEKQVAIKLIRSGLDTDAVIRRFRTERQILANLDHPHIARLLDGGSTEDGLPYLVMEYIEGQPIGAYCDEHRLPIAARLRLFQMVCSAVHYAHQRLVVHLDIKPGNILVLPSGEGGPGMPKLLDFGIARLLDGSVSRTGDTVWLRPLTPDYASPEQIRGEPATVASDIYSLGVLLYELLSGERPHRRRAAPAGGIEGPALDETPTRPSTAAARHEPGKPGLKAQQRIAGDLDNIVLMAMRSDPRRRYASVAQLSEDIERHLNGLPVMARPDTLLYRSGKFLRRHKAGVAAAALIFMAMAAGLVSTAWQARIAARQTAKAQAEQALAEQRLTEFLKLTHSLLFDYHDVIAGLNGSTAVRMRLVRSTLAYLDEVAHGAAGDVGLERQLAAAYLKLGDLQGRPYSANLGDTAGALVSYRRAVALLEPLAATHPNDEGLRADLAGAYDARGRLLTRTLDYDASIADLRSALGIRTQLAAAHPGNEDYREKTAATSLALGDPLLYSLRYRDALEAYGRAEDAWRRLTAAHPGDSRLARDWAVSRQRLGSLYDGIATVADALGDSAAARKTRERSFEEYQGAEAISERLAAADPRSPEFRRTLADTSSDTARVLDRLGESEKALELQHRAVDLFSSLSQSDPANQESRFDLLIAKNVLAAILGRAGRLQDAIELYGAGINAGTKLIQADPHNKEARNYLTSIYGAASELLSSAGRQASAVRYAERRLKVDEQSAALFPEEARWRSFVIADRLTIANLLAKSGRAGEARAAAASVAEDARRNVQRPDAAPADLGVYAAVLLHAPDEGIRDRAGAAVMLQSVVEKTHGGAPLLLLNLALARYLSGKPGEAARTAAEIAALLPYPPELRDAATVRRDIEALAGGEGPSAR